MRTDRGRGKPRATAHEDTIADGGSDTFVASGDHAVSDAALDATIDGSTPGGAPRGASAVPARGDTLAHFTVLEILGQGGMGVVLAAYDPALDRKVAIKLLRSDVWGETPVAGQQRLLREAQALARLSHPNVVTVHEVGVVDDRVYVAMEHVDGSTVAGWLRAGPRSWREVVGVFRQAGAGLAAAHAAGMVHRDFKPENVLLRKDGRVLVTDFGLVSAAGASPDLATPAPASGAGPASSSGSIPLAMSLTHTGTVLGTPAYMAPEQHERAAIDARADQFSFCVALYEALWGRRPFEARELDELRLAVTTGRMLRPPADSEVPGFVRAVVLRGLATRPEDRFPSMDALLAALDADPLAGRRRRLLLAGAAGGFVVLAGIAVLGFTRGGATSACQVGDDELAGVWDPARRDEVRRAFTATSRAHADATYTRVAHLLDGHAEDWLAMRRDACEASARGRQSGQLLDLRMQCLDRRRDELAALTALFARGPDVDLLNKAVSAAAGLTPIASCADAEALSSAVALPDDPTARARVLELHRQLDEVDALGRSGKWKDAVPIAERIAGEARAVEHAPLVARALYLLGTSQDKAGDPRAAEASLRDALDRAAIARDHDLIARAWIGLLEVIGHEQMDAEQALALRQSAELAVKVTGDPRHEANLLRTLGRVLTKKGEFAAARREYERALIVAEQAFGATSPEVAATLQGLAIACDRLGDFAESRRHYDRALAAFRGALGEQHPAVGGVLHDIGALLSHQDRNGEARGFYEQALPIFIGSLGPDHPHVATVSYNLGILARDLGDYEAAAGYYQQSGEIYERTLGADHPDVASALSSLGTVRRLQGRLEEGMALYRDALARLERSVGPDHIDTAVVLESMALGLEEDGQLDEARAAYDRVLAIAIKAYGEDNPNVGDTLVNLGNLEARRGHHAEAKQHLERALEIAIASQGADSVDAGQGHHALADLWRQQGQHRKALDAYRRALVIFEKQLGADHGYVGVTLTGIGLCELGLGRAAAAIEPLERAVAIARDKPVDATSLPSAQQALERARAAAR